MRCWAQFLLGAVLILAASATAQLGMSCPHGDPDNICIIFDDSTHCCQNCLMPPVPIELTAYFVLHNCSTVSGVSGFEFSMCNPDGSPFSPPPMVFVQSYDLPNPGFNALTPPYFAIGLETPILNGGFCTLLMSMDLLVVTPECFCFGIGPMPGPPLSPPPSIPGEMVYASGSDPGLLVAMQPCTGPDDDSCVMACVNCAFCPPGPPIAAQSSTWGALKSMYH